MKVLLLMHSLFYISSGLWPIVHYRSFEKVTGPKTDKWLVITVGWMITASGLALFVAFINETALSEVITLALANTFFLAMVDLYYVRKKVISSVYLFDAGMELVLMGAWLIVLFSRY